MRHDRASFGGRQVDRLPRATGLSPRKVVEVDGLPAIAAMVAAGAGVAIASPFGPPPPPGVRAVPVGSGRAWRELGVATAGVAEDQSPRSVLLDLICGASRHQTAGAIKARPATDPDPKG